MEYVLEFILSLTPPIFFSSAMRMARKDIQGIRDNFLKAKLHLRQFCFHIGKKSYWTQAFVSLLGRKKTPILTKYNVSKLSYVMIKTS